MPFLRLKRRWRGLGLAVGVAMWITARVGILTRHKTIGGEGTYSVARPGWISRERLIHGEVYPRNRPEKRRGPPAEQQSIFYPIRIRYQWQAHGVPGAAQVPPNGL